ncbi:MAG: hypothetical protein FK734_01225 [Asgard group archaeon]|nr:hypothetical protein [Asgard group archaeon]
MVFKKIKDQTLKKDEEGFSPVIIMSEETPKDIEDLVLPVTTLLGILKFDIILKSGKIIYSYNRWGNKEKTLGSKELLQLTNNVAMQLTKIDQQTIEHMILRTKDMNLIIISVKNLLIFTQCNINARIPMITLKVKRIANRLSELL